MAAVPSSSTLQLHRASPQHPGSLRLLFSRHFHSPAGALAHSVPPPGPPQHPGTRDVLGRLTAPWATASVLRWTLPVRAQRFRDSGHLPFLQERQASILNGQHMADNDHPLGPWSGCEHHRRHAAKKRLRPAFPTWARAKPWSLSLWPPPPPPRWLCQSLATPILYPFMQRHRDKVLVGLKLGETRGGAGKL